MKLAIAIASADAPPSAFVVWRGFEESIAKAGELGYHGVELALAGANDVQPEKLHRWLARGGLAVSAISTGQIFANRGLYFTHPDAAVRDRTVKVFEDLAKLAAEFGGIINVGRVRGPVGPGQTPTEARTLFTDVMSRILDFAGPRGVKIIIEPVNRYEINFVNTLDDAAAVLAPLAGRGAGLMPDVFHMNIEEARIGESLRKHGPLVAYIHLADSNRLAPGQGHLDFDEVFDALDAINFDGWASVEILPLPDCDTAARQAARFLLPRINGRKTRRSKHGDKTR
ncbi:MAG: sugar phosphate isomerase/epimerase [Planctomycetes bacterium]|nr:sugar phosphate isomerase/epimerase [Planctomycetota bacterium]